MPFWLVVSSGLRETALGLTTWGITFLRRNYRSLWQDLLTLGGGMRGSASRRQLCAAAVNPTSAAGESGGCGGTGGSCSQASPEPDWWVSLPFLHACGDGSQIGMHVSAGADNKGHQLLAKMGWKEGTGLGANAAGITAPVQADNAGQHGLGVGANGAVEVSVR